MRNISVEHSGRPLIEDYEIEMVERKGIGHPDTICDALAEEISKALSKEYIKRFGEVLHHNVDKIALAAGASKPEFGGGEIMKPIKIILIGRASSEYRGEEIPVDEIAIKACRNYLQNNMFNLKVENIEIESYLSHGSNDLVSCFERNKKDIPLANDTSFGVGYAPYSRLEEMVLKVTETLNSPKYRIEHPWIGEDVKVMGLRDGNDFLFTLGVAFVDKFVSSLSEYISLKRQLEEDVLNICEEINKEQKKRADSISVSINTADHEDNPDSVYITVTGLSAEMGDDGMVGRGNRSNGLITPNRPMSLEAACGKNPINHVGKIYNVLADELSNRIYSEVKGIEEVYVDILSSIGRPIDQPKKLSVKVSPKEGVKVKSLEKEIVDIANDELDNIRSVSKRLIEGELRTY